MKLLNCFFVVQKKKKFTTNTNMYLSCKPHYVFKFMLRVVWFKRGFANPTQSVLDPTMCEIVKILFICIYILANPRSVSFRYIAIVHCL